MFVLHISELFRPLPTPSSSLRIEQIRRILNLEIQTPSSQSTLGGIITADKRTMWKRFELH